MNEYTQQCSTMKDEELIRSVTLDKDEYSEQFHEMALRELSKRGLEISELSRKIKVSLNNQEEEICTVEQALSKLKIDIDLWNLWRFTNFLNETLIFQKESLLWIVHYFFDEDYEMSFFVKTLDEAERILPLFSRADKWEDIIKEEYYLDEWETLVKSGTYNYVKNIAKILSASDIPHTVTNTEIQRYDTEVKRYDPILSTQYIDDSLYILAPNEYMETANEIIKEIETEIQNLYERASELAEIGDSAEELEIYNQLTRLAPGDPAVFYNKGVILFQLGNYKEAVDSFLEVISLNAELEYINGAEEFLLQISKQMPQDVEILHLLANISTIKDDATNAIKRYKEILFANPSDSLAHLNLGYLYYENTESNARVVEHLKKYLEIEPQTEDRSVIEEILSQL